MITAQSKALLHLIDILIMNLFFQLTYYCVTFYEIVLYIGVFSAKTISIITEIAINCSDNNPAFIENGAIEGH